MKWKLSDAAALGFMVLVVGVYFSRLFWPIPRLIVTPDFGSSDAWHASFAMKYALWESLHTGTLPFWNRLIGDGFPLFAEGQVGALYIPNLLLFSLPDPVSAYNLASALAILTIAWGMYAFLRVLGASQLPALLGGITIGFSGLSIAHLTHLTLLQGMSLLPWMALASLWVTRYPRYGMIALGLIGSQQFFTGFPQGALISWIFCTGLIGWQIYKTKTVRSVFPFAGGLFLSLGLAGAQLIPSIEFLRESQHAQGFDLASATFFSFPLKHLATFLSPFLLGSPRNATYPFEALAQGSVFWENIAFLGIIPLIPAIWAIATRGSTTNFFALIAVLSLLLALGRHSPLYFMYALWPFTLFRVPSRFLWLTVMAVTSLAALGIERLFNVKHGGAIRGLVALAILAQSVHLSATWWNYHALEKASDWIRRPDSAAALKEGRAVTIGSISAYSALVRTKGWEDMKSFAFLDAALIPNSNLLWGISQHGVKAGRYLRRAGFLDNLLTQSVREDREITFATSGAKLLDLMAVRNVLSLKPITSQQFQQTYALERESLTVRLYENTHAPPRVYVASEATTASTLTQAVSRIMSDNFQPGKTVLLEEHEIAGNASIAQLFAAKPGAAQPTPMARITLDTNEKTVISVSSSSTPVLLVIADTQYPGWGATADGKSARIFTANLAQRAVIVPAGATQVTFTYSPRSFLWGIAVSLATLGVTAILTVVRIPSWLVRRA